MQGCNRHNVQPKRHKDVPSMDPMMLTETYTEYRSIRSIAYGLRTPSSNLDDTRVSLQVSGAIICAHAARIKIPVMKYELQLSHHVCYVLEISRRWR